MIGQIRGGTGHIRFERGTISSKTFVLLALSAVVLSACENPRRAFGLEKQAPDEFQVVARAPLNLPPEFSLRPPEPGAARPDVTTPRDVARSAVFKLEEVETPAATAVPAPADAAGATGEQALLARAGANGVAPDIRLLVDQESNVLREADESFLNRLLTFRDPDQVVGAVVDPEAEARRLREAEALGLPVTTGETPQIERKRRGLLEGLF